MLASPCPGYDVKPHQGSSGGGIFNAGSLIVRGTLFEGNAAGSSGPGGGFEEEGGSGGAIAVERFGAAATTISGSDFHRNSAGSGKVGGHGGAISNYDALEIKDTVFRNNIAGAGGRGGSAGAIWNLRSDVTLDNVVVRDNLAGLTGDESGDGGWVGGISNLSGNLTISPMTSSRASDHVKESVLQKKRFSYRMFGMRFTLSHDSPKSVDSVITARPWAATKASRARRGSPRELGAGLLKRTAWFRVNKTSSCGFETQRDRRHECCLSGEAYDRLASGKTDCHKTIKRS